MNYAIKGCLMKYDTPWFDGTIIKPGAFDSSNHKKVPCLYNGESPDDVVGFAELVCKEDGIYYEFYSNESDRNSYLIKKIISDNYMPSLFANKVVKEGTNVIKAEILNITFAPETKDQCTNILEIITDNADTCVNKIQFVDHHKKLCPLCGSKPKTEFGMEDSETISIRIFCPKCELSIKRTSTVDLYSIDKNPAFAFSKAEQLVIDVWNKRFTDGE